MRTINWSLADSTERVDALRRPVESLKDNISDRVQEILKRVLEDGDEAVAHFTDLFDGLQIINSQVDASDIELAVQNSDSSLREAIDCSIDNLNTFHKASMVQDAAIETQAGVYCSRQSRPIESVGFYIPGGSAPLPSTVMMLAIPAQLAGVKHISLCSPAQADGEIHPTVLYAANRCGIRNIYRIGGAQAIAAMAYGTSSIRPADKIFGPGNAWVTEAKQQVSMQSFGAANDMPAGPSEVMVIADNDAHPDFVAADLLAQAEHGVDSHSLLLCLSEQFAKRVTLEITNQLAGLSRRGIIEQSLKLGTIILVDNIDSALEISNHYAPEHLILQFNNCDAFIHKITSAGSVFIGPWSPESAGDYSSGTNHVLPTYGYARSYSGLSVSSFQKQITFQKLSYDGLQGLANSILTLAHHEGLDAHANAVSIRSNRS